MSTHYPFDAIDLGFMLLAPTHPLMFGACVVQYFARRSPWVVRALLDAGAAIPRESEKARALLPGLEKLTALPPPPAPAAHLTPRPVLASPQRRPDAAERVAAIDARARAQTRSVLTLSDIADLDNVWVVGPKGSGKTTVLRALIAQRSGQHTALDPHNKPGKWPCAVIGGGRRYEAISAALVRQVATMTQRYIAMDAGELDEDDCRGAARQTVVGDEWLSVSDALPGRPASRGEEAEPGAATLLLNILTEGRKAGVCVMAASHADTATAMGLLGKKDVLKCFDRVVYLGALAVARHAPAASMRRPAVVYDPERDSYEPIDLTGIAAAVASPPVEADDPLLAALLAGGAATTPTDDLTQDERERLTLARRLAPTMGKTKAIKAAFNNPSGEKHKKYGRAFDRVG